MGIVDKLERFRKEPLNSVRRTIRNKFTKYFFANLSGGYAPLPPNIILFVTHRCDLKCSYCYVHESNKKRNKKDEMSFSELKRIIDKISRFKPTISITGGEPLLRADLTKLIRYAQEKGCDCILFTNGLLLTNKIAKGLVDSGLGKVCISIGGSKNIDEKTIKAIGLIREERRKKTFPKVGLLCTVSTENQDNLSSLACGAKKIKADFFTFRHLYYSRNDLVREHNDRFKDCFGLKSGGLDRASVSIPNAEKVIDQIRKIILDREAKKRFYPDLSLGKVFKYYSDCAHPLRKRCLYPWFFGSIKPNGDLSLCFHKYIVGNLKNQGFKDLWNNKKARHFREVLLKEKYFPACTRCCGLFVYQ